MDNTTKELAGYASALAFEHLTPSAIHEAKRRLIDAIGCAMGGCRSEPAIIARKVAMHSSGVPAARVLGSDYRSSMEMAAFANAVMLRYLDFNDTYVSLGGGHPSDMLPAILAVGEAYRADGKSVLTAMAAAYEMFGALADVAPLRQRGWDQGVYVVLGSAAGAGKLLGLTPKQLANALAIAISANVPTRQARSGELSMWKGCATPAATRAGVFAALLAKEGMTGPAAAFEGRHGIWEQVTGPFRIGPMGGSEKSFAVERSNLKYFPSEYHSQAPLWMALELRKKVPVADIALINIQTYHMAYSEIGSEPEKWNPHTRETADHSLPYLFAAALCDGAITEDTFTLQRLQDPGLLRLMGRIRISENPAFTRQYPGALVSEIEVLTVNGRRHVERAAYPKGHVRNPLTDGDVESKFNQLCAAEFSAGQRKACLDAMWNLENLQDIGMLLDLMRLDDTK